MEAISDFIHQPPGCRQGTSLEPVVWHYCPAAKRGPFGPWEFWIDDATPWSRRSAMEARRLARTRTHGRSRRARVSHGAHGGHGALATITACTERARRTRHDHGMHASVTAHAADTASALRPRRARYGHCARYGHGMHASIAARTARHGRRCGRSGPGGLGSATDTSRAAEWIAKRGRRAAEGGSSVACEASRGERDLGRASERFESERHQRSERLRPGPRARRLSEGRPATAVTAGTVPVTAGTAADHGGHDA